MWRRSPIVRGLMQLRSQRKRPLVTDATEEPAVTAASRVREKKPRGSARPPARNGVEICAVEADDAQRAVHRYPRLVPARLIRRYKRFLADVVLVDADDESPVDEKNAVTIYCPNTGPMVGLLDEPLPRVQLSKSDDPKRKYAYTLEMVRIHNGERHVWVGVHSASANYMVERALTNQWFRNEIGAFDALQREVKFAKNSRVDFVLSTHDEAGDVVHQKYVEVKSVTLAQFTSDDDGNVSTLQRCAVFPDTVSERASKHVQELMELIHQRKEANAQAVEHEGGAAAKPKRVSLSGAIVFVVQRDDCDAFMPSLVHDNKFAQLCAEAEAAGIQLLAYACRLEPHEAEQKGLVRLLRPLPLHAQRAQVSEKAEAEADEEDAEKK